MDISHAIFADNVFFVADFLWQIIVMMEEATVAIRAAIFFWKKGSLEVMECVGDSGVGGSGTQDF